MNAGEPVAPLLEVRGLAMHFPISEGIFLARKIGNVKAVDGVDFTIKRGETLGLVGESGCGKTTTGRLHPAAGSARRPGQIPVSTAATISRASQPKEMGRPAPAHRR